MELITVIIIILIGIGILIFVIDNIFYFKTEDDKIDEFIKKGIYIYTLVKPEKHLKINFYHVMIINRKVYALKTKEKKFGNMESLQKYLIDWKYNYIMFDDLQKELIRSIRADKIDSIQIHYLKGR